MLLESITLKNFRQYYGEQIITFSTSKEQNVTVIHGENGSGKTALLNAFSWCLYGFLNLPQPHSIINEHAVNQAVIGDSISAEVTIEFWDRELKYILSRSYKGKKGIEGNVEVPDSDVKLVYIRNGVTHKVNNPSVEINRILPENLRSYFFFDGERIDNLSKEEGSRDVKDAIKTMMGLEILERSMKHTETARKRFLEEMKNYSDSDTIALIEKEEALEKEIDNFNTMQDQYEKNISLNNKQIKEKEDRLKEIEGSKQLQEKRDHKQKELDAIKEELEKCSKQIVDQISKRGYLAFSGAVVDRSRKELEGIGEGVGVITGVSSDFIRERLEKKECICGETLTPESSGYKNVETMLEYLAPKSLDSAIAGFKGDLKVVDIERKNLFHQLKSLKQFRLQLKQRIRELQEQIEEISKQLSSKDSEEIADLEKSRNKLVDHNAEMNQKIGRICFERENKAEELKEIQKTRKKTESKLEKATLTQKRMDTCEKLVQVMGTLFNIREKAVKENLQQRISEVYAKFLRKGYTIQLTDEYELKVINQNDKQVGMSQGERQITSLSFIGAIVDIAREHYNREQKQTFEEGGIYPLVMDSPFGALDSDHRERIAQGINKLADQVIVIVSTSQWRGEVEGQMKELIGKEYTLKYNDPRHSSQPSEFTEVREVN
ncbi:AAA family ATPase [Bacillus infantis]|uniref:AAA family ATPase n=1 Tax=Bacillus infantis TaxID=324767 RepID=UPI0020053883|nr:AAA family ATPase [Bacillus infantis]